MNQEEMQMCNVHKYRTISFRPSDNERRTIEQRIKVSGLSKKRYYINSCIYNRVCVVGKKETIYPLVEELRDMHRDIVGRIENKDEFSNEDKQEYLEFTKALLWMLEGAEYLWRK